MFIPPFLISDCTSYLVCEHKKYVLRHCPLELQWNNQKQICDHPENTQCNEESKIDLEISNYLSSNDNYTQFIEDDFYTEEFKEPDDQ